MVAPWARCFGVIALTGLSAPCAHAQPSVAMLAPLNGTSESHARGVSADGAVVVGFSGSENFYTGRATRWPQPGAPEELPMLAGQTQSYARAVTANGLVAVGYCGFGPTSAVLWDGGGVHSLGTLANWQVFQPFAVNADGTVISGRGMYNGDERAFRWRAGVGLEDLTSLSGAVLVDSYGVSGDGLFCVGTQGVTPSELPVGYRWSDAGGVQSVGLIPGGGYSWSYGVSADGSVVVGDATSPDGNSHAFRRAFPSAIQDLGVLPGSLPEIRGSVANAVSGDGLTVVGNGGRPVTGHEGAFLWTQQTGMVDLQVHLAGLGVDLTGWDLQIAFAANQDGTVIVGDGTFNNQPRGWVARLRGPCGSADFNCDGAIATDSDIESFFACLTGACPPPPCMSNADFDGDGAVGTDADIEAFFRVLAGGAC
jgi:probable HAF family extracellular repeat protein